MQVLSITKDVVVSTTPPPVAAAPLAQPAPSLVAKIRESAFIPPTAPTIPTENDLEEKRTSERLNQTVKSLDNLHITPRTLGFNSQPNTASTLFFAQLSASESPAVSFDRGSLFRSAIAAYRNASSENSTTSTLSYERLTEFSEVKYRPLKPPTPANNNNPEPLRSLFGANNNSAQLQTNIVV